MGVGCEEGGWNEAERGLEVDRWRSGGGQTGVVEHRGCRSELCAGAVGVCQEVEKQQTVL